MRMNDRGGSDRDSGEVRSVLNAAKIANVVMAVTGKRRIAWKKG